MWTPKYRWLFNEYDSDDMVVDEKDKQSTQGDKVMCFVYFIMYGMMLVAPLQTTTLP